MSFRKTLLAATLLSLPMAATANAQSWDPRVQGIYVGAGLGANYLDNSDSDRTSTSFEWGWVGVLSVGYGYFSPPVEPLVAGQGVSLAYAYRLPWLPLHLASSSEH